MSTQGEQKITRMTNIKIALAMFFVVGCLAGCNGSKGNQVEILNVSYDPTRELYRELNNNFSKRHEAATGQKVSIRASHAGSSTQARAVIDGNDADVVTLAMWTDVDAIRKKGLIKEGWEESLPNHSLPYLSTIVFVVRKGNPKNIKDWPDLIRDGIKVITPNPKTSGNGKLSFLAAYGAILEKGGTEQEAADFVGKLYSPEHVPVLDTGARGSTTTFSQKKIGDVHLTWENEAHLELEEAKGELEIVYPTVSIQAEPYVAVVDANVDKKKTREISEAYLKSLYSKEGQEIIAKHKYRPIDADVLAKHKDDLPAIKLFTITRVAKSWDDAQTRFFADDAMFDKIYSKK